MQMFSTYKLPIGLFFFSLGLYLYTLTPTIGFHDSGDMVTSAYCLGIAHPPGYPLYCLIGKLFSIIPLGNIAYRLNLMSAVFASLTILFTYTIVAKTTHKIIPAAVSAISLALAATFWEQAIVAEKYTLNACFTSILIFALLKWQKAINDYGYNNKYLYVFSLILGLSFTHHFQTLYLLPASIYFLFIAHLNELKRIKKVALIKAGIKAGIIFFIPLLLYLYLPLRAATHPFANWGDPQTFDRFISHITVASYKHYFSVEALKMNFFSHLQFFPQQFTLGFFIIADLMK